MNKDSEPWDMAAHLRGAESSSAPQDTRDYLIRMLEVHRLRLTNGVGQHLMRAWPTSF